jgi:hypothetical protein
VIVWQLSVCICGLFFHVLSISFWDGVSAPPLRESQVSQGKGTLVIFWFVKWKQKTMDPIKKHWLGHDEK